jgi:hypothetical protein
MSDIFEQVENLLNRIEKRDYENRYKHLLDEAYILEELSKRYINCIQLNKWELANDLLSQISRLVILMNSE